LLERRPSPPFTRFASRHSLVLPAKIRPGAARGTRLDGGRGEGEGEENAVAGVERVPKESPCVIRSQDPHLASVLGIRHRSRDWLSQPPARSLLERRVKHGIVCIGRFSPRSRSRASRDTPWMSSGASLRVLARKRGRMYRRGALVIAVGLCPQVSAGSELEPAVEVLVQGQSSASSLPWSHSARRRLR